MATEATFEAAATAFDEEADQLRASVLALDAAWGDDVVVGGRLSRTVDRAVDATYTNTMSVVAEFNGLADECRRRAAICAEYTDAMNRYRSAMTTYRHERNAYLAGDRPGSAPRPPVEPVRPAPWVHETPAGMW